MVHPPDAAKGKTGGADRRQEAEASCRAFEEEPMPASRSCRRAPSALTALTALAVAAAVGLDAHPLPALAATAPRPVPAPAPAAPATTAAGLGRWPKGV